jgi:hypothetical protein
MFPILVSVVVGFLMYLLGTVIGNSYLEILRSTEGMVTATEVVECKYVIPVVLAVAGAYLSYKIVKMY